MAGLSTKGITLSCKKSGNEEFKKLPNLLTMPELGGERSKINVTTLDDDQEKFIPGIKSVGDMGFSFLYDADREDSSFRTLKSMEDDEKAHPFKVTFPDKTEFSFDAYVALMVNEAEVDGKITFVANLIPNSKIVTNLSDETTVQGQTNEE